MIARFTAASLGLFAFAVTVVAGLVARNPVTTTLSRSILALFLFCAVGFLLGSVAQRIVTEYKQQRELEIHERFPTDTPATEGGDSKDGVLEGAGTSGGG